MKFRGVFIEVLILVLLGFLAGSRASELSGPTTLVNGLRVGEIGPFAPTSNLVLHIEVDLLDSNKLIFSEGSAISVTDGVTTTRLVGSSRRGYTEGVGTKAQFYYIFGFKQINSTAVMVADTGNNCLRLFNRKDLKTSKFAGICGQYGFKDGIHALFNAPVSIIKHFRMSNLLLVPDSYYRAVRQVDLVSRITTTLISKSDGLGMPSGLALDVNGESLLITNDHKINRYCFASEVLTNVTGGSAGFSDGSLDTAQFNNPLELVALSRSIFLVADKSNNRLRVVNTEEGVVESICTGSSGITDGSAGICELRSMYSVLAEDDVIYIGHSRRIRKMSFNVLGKKTPPPETKKLPSLNHPKTPPPETKLPSLDHPKTPPSETKQMPLINHPKTKPSTTKKIPSPGHPNAPTPETRKAPSLDHRKITVSKTKQLSLLDRPKKAYKTKQLTLLDFPKKTKELSWLDRTKKAYMTKKLSLFDHPKAPLSETKKLSLLDLPKKAYNTLYASHFHHGSNISPRRA